MDTNSIQAVTEALEETLQAEEGHVEAFIEALEAKGYRIVPKEALLPQISLSSSSDILPIEAENEGKK